MSETQLVHKPGEPVTQFSLFLENRVGAFQSILANLERLNIHTLGCTVRDSTEVSILRVILSDPDAALQFFLEKGIAFARCEVLVIELPTGAADLSDMLLHISHAETNVDFLYPMMISPAERPLMVLHTDDLDVARIALHASGFRICYQQDLSR